MSLRTTGIFPKGGESVIVPQPSGLLELSTLVVIRAESEPGVGTTIRFTLPTI